jgi:hypothetical protein
MKTTNFLKYLASLALVFSQAPGLFSQAPGNIFPGADQNTPSRSEYFSWINNTGEGSTEAQTMANLDFFGWLREEYGMILDIYAFDAGNIDKHEYRGSSKVSKFDLQFPNGFGQIAEKAGTMGTRLGVWDAPDRFGNTPAEEKAQIDYMVSLCKDYHFELFKFDAMGGDLRDDKQDAFVRMMTECRKYSPDLILLNHRINLGPEAVKQATTFLLGGDETYIDVHMANDRTATHHREGALSREVVPGLKRLTEDHGVCLSSCLDYWEDDLVLQAFNRNLILAPEIYGNPWLLRDDEYPQLARIFNLTRKYGDILVNGIILPENRYGEKAVSRGDSRTRLITLRNIGWTPVKRRIRLDKEIGLEGGRMVELKQLHPTERVIGRYRMGQIVEVEVLPFRSCLLVATTEPDREPEVEGCDYQIVRNIKGKPLEINIMGFPGEMKTIRLKGVEKSGGEATLDGKPVPGLRRGRAVKVFFPGVPLKEAWHRKLGDLQKEPVPDDAEALYEATCFAADNNALEARSLARSGPTNIPEVEKARDAFFNQEVFIARGLWDRYLFDGDHRTAFYPGRRWGKNDFRINGGAFRIDLGRAVSLDSLKIYTGDEQGLQPFKSWESLRIQVSTDLKNWRTIEILAGPEMTLPFDPQQPVRFIRFPATPERVEEVEGYLKGSMVNRSGWRASNLFSPYRYMTPKDAFETQFVLNEIPEGSYLAIALNGKHGNEGAYAAIRVDGQPVGAPDRSVSYRSNAWEYPVVRTDSNYTYYIPLTPAMIGKTIDAVVLVMKDGVSEFQPEVWVTAYPVPYEKMVVEVL